jgi:hypothetical protein
MVLVIAALLLAFVIVIALVATRRKDAADERAEFAQNKGKQNADKQSTDKRNTDKLPVGADAALWSIVEAVPDPRNHLALTRDLTGEVRIAGTLLDSALHLDSIPVGVLPNSKPMKRVAPVAVGTGSVRIIAERIQGTDTVDTSPAIPTDHSGDSLERAS